MEQGKAVPAITIYPWPDLAVPKEEIQNVLTYLAYKTGKPVTFRWYTEDEGYSENSVSVRIVVNDGLHKTSRTNTVRFGQDKYVLAEDQVTVDIDVPEEKQILDDDFLTLAYVDHNRIIVPIELTITDNEAARSLLAYIVERSIELLDFKMTDELLEQRRRLAERFCDTFVKAVEKQFTEQQEQFKDSEAKAEQAYYTVLEFQRRKPIIEKQLKFLKKLKQIHKPRLFRKQTQALIALLASGQYSSMEPNGDGFISATTSAITIQYNNYKFPLGRYTIDINPKGDVRIEALDEHPNADYPHPHVGTDGRPCLGNIAADIPKMLGSFRIAEALATLYEFLCEYDSDSPFERISHFDPTGQYYDEDDNPCENCGESCTPYCIHECGDNTGQYQCEDCCDYRTDYCYTECSYNEDFERFSPCDACDDEGTEHCYLDCQYNEQWQLHKPCDENCEFEECSSECPYFEKLQQLKEVAKNASTR